MILFTFDRRSAGFELWALFVGVLAYPHEEQKRDLFMGARICAAVRGMELDRTNFAGPPTALRLACGIQNPSLAERATKEGCRIISRQRLPAAKMARPEFHAYLADKISEPRPGIVPSHGSTDMLTSISHDLDDKRRPRDSRGRKPYGGDAEMNTGHIMARCWKPSLPVLHLAITLAEAMPGDSLEIDDPLFNRKFVLSLIEQSESKRPFVAEKFNIPPSAQVRIDDA